VLLPQHCPVSSPSLYTHSVVYSALLSIWAVGPGVPLGALMCLNVFTPDPCKAMERAECWSSSVAASARTNSTHSSVRRVYADFGLLAGTYVMHTDFSYFFVYFSTCRSYSCTELIPYFVAAALVSRLYKSSHFVARASVDSVTTEVSLLHTSLYSYSTLTVPQRLTYLQVS
jgi:hypothetical protein